MSFRPRLTFVPNTACLVVIAASISVACQPDIGDLDTLPDPSEIVVAQFDPTNPVPQLRLLPSPTRLAQNADGTIDQDAVRPDACELPTAAQCLSFVEGWPVTTPLTFNFSGPLDDESLADGVKIFEVQEDGSLAAVEVAFTQLPREAPPTDCDIDDDIVRGAWGPDSVDLVVRTATGTSLKPSTRYIAIATRDLRGTDNRQVEPSPLFFLLNQDTPPTNDEGIILNPILRGTVEGSALAQLFPGRDPSSFSDEERTTFAEAVATSATRLQGLYIGFIQSIVEELISAEQLTDRSELVMVNAWQTGSVDPIATFDPQGSAFPTDIRIPFPNNELLTVPSDERPTGLNVNFPISDDGPDTINRLIAGLNTLDGFGMTSAITIPTTAYIDQDSLNGNVIIAELENGQVTDNIVPAVAIAESEDSGLPSQIYVAPVASLQPATTYAIGITSNVRTVDGEQLGSSTTFDLLKTPAPIISEGEVLADVVPALQCADVPRTGRIADDEALINLATALEVQLGRPRWQTTFQTFEAAGYPRTELSSAFTYTTHSEGALLTTVKEQLIPAIIPPLSQRFPVTIDTASTAPFLFDVRQNWCADDSSCPFEDGPETDALNAALSANVASVETLTIPTLHFLEGNPLAGSGTFSRERFDNPALTTELVNAIFFVPVGERPDAGWPTVIFQHGFGGSKESATNIANTYAAEGWATLAIDLPYHGERARDLIRITDGEPEFCAPDEECDGIPEPSGTGFLSANIFATRDSYRQTTIDQLILLYLANNGLITVDGEIPLVDGTQVGYAGQSLGGITGGNLVSYAGNDQLVGAVLNVAGGDQVGQLLGTVPAISAPLYAGLAGIGVCELTDPSNPALGCESTPLFNAFLNLSRWVLEPGDPRTNALGVNQALFGRTDEPMGSENVLIQVANPDLVVPNSSSESLAQTLQFDTEDPDGNYQVYDFSETDQDDCHAFLLAPLCGQCAASAICETLGAQQQSAIFIADGEISEQVPEVLFEGTPLEIDCANPCD